MGEGTVMWCITAACGGSSGEWWRLYSAPGWSRDRTKPVERCRLPTPLELYLPDGKVKFGRAKEPPATTTARRRVN